MNTDLEFGIGRGLIKCTCEAIQCYMAIQELYGANNCYIFESLAGPSQDVNSAYVGFDKVLSISIKDSYLNLQGDSALIDYIKSNLKAINTVIIDGLEIYVREGHIFDVLSFITGLFNKEECNTKLSFLSFISYESIRYIEDIPDLNRVCNYEIPDIVLDLYRGIIEFNLNDNSITYEELKFTGQPVIDWVNIESTLQRYTKYDLPIPEIYPVNTIKDSMSKSEFLEVANECLQHIANGDIYQIQIGHEISISTNTRPFDVYLRLREINPSPYMYFAPINSVFSIGASPELFVRKNGRTIEMRPIAGTTKRTHDEELDNMAIEKLKCDEKEIAEHLMLIDLCRNDLAKVCSKGTLELTRQFFVETYSHVFHLVSDLQIDLEDVYDIFDVIKATFPAGTMTGTPKIESMKLIEKYENNKRGLYAGAIGQITLNGDAVLALCIRTALYYAGNYHIRASAGIVADSKPCNEWNETLNKLAATYLTISGKSLLD